LFLYFQFLIVIQGTSSVFALGEKPGNADGPGLSAMFYDLIDIAINQQTGDLFVCDYGNHSILKVNSTGVNS
jgi:hypothetical protein